MNARSHFDELLRAHAGTAPLSEQERARLSAVSSAELTRPQRAWRRDAFGLALAAFGMSAGVTTVLLGIGNTSPALVLSRLATVVPLMVLGVAAAWLAVAPGLNSGRWAAVIAAGFAMAAIVFARGAGHPGSLPQWVCTVSHLSLGLGPLVWATMMLRRMAANMVRSLVAGLAVGTVGAVTGEVGCDQGWQHVLLFHLTPWLVLTATAVLMSRRAGRWSYAP